MIVALGGIKEDDFTFVYGFPGKTQEYLTSYAVDIIANVSNPNRVKVREQRLAIIEEAMRNDEKIHIQYSSKKSVVANGWKKWQAASVTLDLNDILRVNRKPEIHYDLSTRHKYVCRVSASRIDISSCCSSDDSSRR